MQLAVSMTLGQLTETLFGVNAAHPPGALRVLNHAGEVMHPSTQLGFMHVPRMIYFQTGSLSKFDMITNRIESMQHDRVLSREAEARLQLVNCRIFGTFVSVFRSMEQTQRVQSMQSTINDNLEQRIRDLEAHVAQLQQQLVALMPVVIVPEPETEVEP